MLATGRRLHVWQLEILLAHHFESVCGTDVCQFFSGEAVFGLGTAERHRTMLQPCAAGFEQARDDAQAIRDGRVDNVQQPRCDHKIKSAGRKRWA